MSSLSIQSPSLHQVLGGQVQGKDDEFETVDLSHREPVAAKGGLIGKTISVGTGEERTKSINAGGAILKGLKVVGLVLASPLLLAGGAALLAAKAISLVPRLINEKLLEPAAERKWQSIGDNKAMWGALTTPMDNSLANRTSSTPGNPSVMDRLLAHAATTGKPGMSADDIRSLVAAGERIAQALGNSTGNGRSPLAVTVDGQAFEVPSNTYTARALSWYMMAAAANQDMVRGQQNPGDKTSDMPTNGSMVMKDPGNKIYNFLASAPTAASRMSTHFAERSATTEQHKIGGLIPSGKISQRGIEDYQSRMPGGGGTMLFDKLRNDSKGTGELFVKFEHGGTPPYFQSEPHMGVGQRISRFFAALDRNIGHAVSFIATRFDKTNPSEVRRQEHVYKGVLKETIHKPFAKLIESAIGKQLIDADAKAVGKAVHKLGLPYVQDALEFIINQAEARGDTESRQQVVAVRENVIAEMHRLGMMSSQLNIERRGAEVHISLDVHANQRLR